MKNLISISVILTALSGCSDETVSELSATVTNELLQGTWAAACEIDENETASFISEVTFIDNSGNFTTTQYTDTMCTNGAAPQMPQEFSYVLGVEIILDVIPDGAANIEKAAEIDIVFDSGTQLNLIAIDNLTSLYFGDDADIDTDITRPTTLENKVFELQ